MYRDKRGIDVTITTMGATFRVFWREMRRIGGRSSMWGLMLAAPILLYLLLAAVYTNRVVADLKVAVVDQDRTELSRTVDRAIDITKTLNVTSRPNSVDQARSELLDGRIQGIVFIPRGFEAGVKSGEPAEIVVFKNTANLVVGNYVLKEASTIARTLSAGVSYRKARATGKNADAAMNAANPIRVDTHTLYNPTYNYENFLVPGLLTVLFQMIVMLSSVLIVNEEVRERTFGTLVTVADGSAPAIFVGKACAFLFVHSAVAIGMVALLFPSFGIPIHGSSWMAVGFTLYYVAAAFFPAMMVSVLIPDRLTATTVAVFFNTPAFIFSGYTYPLWAMPRLHVLFASILPSTYFLEGFVDIYQRAAPIADLKPYLGVLSLFVWIPIPIIFLALKRKVDRFVITEGVTS